MAARLLDFDSSERVVLIVLCGSLDHYVTGGGVGMKAHHDPWDGDEQDAGAAVGAVYDRTAKVWRDSDGQMLTKHNAVKHTPRLSSSRVSSSNLFCYLVDRDHCQTMSGIANASKLAGMDGLAGDFGGKSL